MLETTIATTEIAARASTRRPTRVDAHTIQGGRSRRELDDALRARGLSAGLFRPWALDVPAGTSLDLHAVAPTGNVARIWTGDADVYRRWLAISDGSAALDRAALAELPPRVGEVTPAERRTLERIASAFLFADSAPWRDYKSTIESHFGPFEAVVVVADAITIAADARLVIAGAPTILVATALDFAGGELTVQTIFNATIGTLTAPTDRIAG